MDFDILLNFRLCVVIVVVVIVFILLGVRGYNFRIGFLIKKYIFYKIKFW